MMALSLNRTAGLDWSWKRGFFKPKNISTPITIFHRDIYKEEDVGGNEARQDA